MHPVNVFSTLYKVQSEEIVLNGEAVLKLWNSCCVRYCFHAARQPDERNKRTGVFALRSVHTERLRHSHLNVGGQHFDLFDGHCDGQKE